MWANTSKWSDFIGSKNGYKMLCSHDGWKIKNHNTQPFSLRSQKPHIRNGTRVDVWAKQWTEYTYNIEVYNRNDNDSWYAFEAHMTTNMNFFSSLQASLRTAIKTVPIFSKRTIAIPISLLTRVHKTFPIFLFSIPKCIVPYYVWSTRTMPCVCFFQVQINRMVAIYWNKKGPSEEKCDREEDRITSIWNDSHTLFLSQDPC